MSWMLALFLMQDAQPQADRVRQAMEKSLEEQRISANQQRASIRKQAEIAGVAGIEWSLGPPPSVPCEAMPQPELSKMIDEVSEKQGLDPSLIREVARQESGFHPCAVSSAGAQGLMQLMPETQVQMQVSNPFDARQSLEGGSKLLKQLLDRYQGDLPRALSAYNAGAGAVDKAGGIPPIAETQKYVLSILTRFLQ
jgi:soluble lytic murein transglycosylase-like protein